MKSMPWKNGGGTTSEVSISPSDSVLSNLEFDWRVSIADVASHGPFSQFPGYERSLVVWKGEGLYVNGIERRTLEVFDFRGEESIQADLIAGSVRDFGVIWKRGLFVCGMRAHTLSENAVGAHESHGDLFILCARGELRVGEFYLNPGDVIHANGPGPIAVTALERSTYVVALVSAASS